MPDAIILGTGQIGVACASLLMRRGWTVSTISRSPVPAGLAGATHIVADRRDGAAFDTAIGDGADLLIDTIAFDAADSLQTVSFIDRLGAVAAISSASVYCDSHGRTLVEADQNGFPVGLERISDDDPAIGPGSANYSTRKSAMEQALLERADGKAIILRPCAIHGPFSRHPREWWFVKRILDGRRMIPLMYDGASRFQTTSVASIATLIADAAGIGARGIFNCADADCPTISEIGRTIAGQLGATVDFVPVAGEPETLGRSPWAVPLPFTQSNEKALRLGIGTFHDYATGVVPAIDWLVRLQPHDWRRAFPTLAAYPWDLFDYAAEDAALAE